MNERTIFLEALERVDPIQRSAFLDTACFGDAELRLRVESLLKSHNEAGSFLGKLAPERLAEELGVRATTGESLGPALAGDYGQALSILTPSDKPDSLGRLGSYEIEEVIGSGGMGIVLRAFDEKLRRVVAIKVMAAPLASNEHARRRFVREGRAAAAIRDDHVIGIYGVDETNGLPFLVMEFVVGRSLAQRIEAEGPLPLAEILRIGAQIAHGLAAAHSQGVVHRDIKPANILLENSVERVKITDFGLAHAVDDVRTTQPGTVIGTPEYMSPEQARGERVDYRSDLFSLGCVLYAMCAGRPPFRADSTVAIIRRVCDDTPRPLAEINLEIPEWLIDLINKLIAKDASVRFQSAAEVAGLLGQYLAHVQQPAINPPPVAITKPPTAHRQSSANARRGWSIAAAVVLLLCAGLSLAESTGMTNVAATVIRIVRGDGTLVVEVDDPNIQVLVDGEELVISGAGPKEIRLRPGQHELHTVKDGKPVGTKLVTITRDGREVVKVAHEAPQDTSLTSPSTRLVWPDAVAAVNKSVVSRDGRFLAFPDSIGDLTVRDLATGKNRSLTKKISRFNPQEFAYAPQFSADGTQLAYTWCDKENKYGLRVIGLEGGEPRVVYTSTDDVFIPFTCGWTPDGKSILAELHLRKESPDSGASAPRGLRRLQLALIATADGSIRIIKSFEYGPSTSGGQRRRLYGVNDGGHTHALSPDGRTIAYSRFAEPTSAYHDIFLIDAETGQDTQVTNHAADKSILAWTPDGQRLLFDMKREGATDAWTIRIAGGKPQGEAELAKRDFGAIHPCGFTRDGTFYYSSSSRGPSIFTTTLDLEKGTAAATPLAAEKFNILAVLSLGDWSPDGEHLAYWVGSLKSPEVRILSMKTGQTRVIKPDIRNMERFRWSPDGRSFVALNAGGHGRGIFQIDAASGQVTTVVESGPVSGPVWSRDSRGIFYGKYGEVPSDAAETFRIVYRDLQTQTEKEFLPPSHPASDGGQEPFMEPSPDGRQLAFLGDNGQTQSLWLINVEGELSRELFKVNTQGTSARLVGWTRDGRFVLFNQRGGEETQRGLWYISANGGEPRKIEVLGVDAKNIWRIAIHPDGKQMALGVSGTGKSEVWALENFLPTVSDPKSTAATDASAATSK